MKSRSHTNLAQLLMAARESALKPFRPILKVHGLTGQQWRVMRALYDAEGPLAANQIAQQCQILPPSLSQILTGMEKRRLVKRARSDEDMRKQQVRLTAEATRIADVISPLIERQYALIEQAVGRPLLLEAADVIERLRRALEAGVPSVLDPDEAPPHSKRLRLTGAR